MSVSSYTVKATYGAETRKWKLNSYGVPKYLDLVYGVRQAFGIEASELHLKYKDSDADLIELSTDDDLALAIALEQRLVIVVSNESGSLPKQLNELRSTLTSLIADATSLVDSLDGFNLHEENSNSREIASSPTKTEPPTTVDPSTMEEVHLSDAQNGNAHENKPQAYDTGNVHENKPQAYDTGNQGYPGQNAQVNSPSVYQQQQQYPPSNQGYPSNASQLPPLSNASQMPPLSNASQMPPLSNSSQLPPLSNANYGYQSQQQLPPSNQGYQPNSSQLPPLQNANYGYPSQQQQPQGYGQQSQVNSFQRSSTLQPAPSPALSQQPPTYAPVNLVKGWNAPPQKFFR